MRRWKARSGSSSASGVGAASIAAKALAMPSSSASLATCAASAAAAGSKMRRTVSRVWTNSPCGLDWISQYSTSGSRRCQSLWARTVAPARCRDITSPLATSTRVASRSTGRLTS